MFFSRDGIVEGGIFDKFREVVLTRRRKKGNFEDSFEFCSLKRDKFSFIRYFSTLFYFVRT